MLDEFPETLVNIEWHSPGYTPGGSDFDLPSDYSQRGGMYGVGGIPHTQWNGVQETVGGYPNGNWSPMYSSFISIYNGMVGDDTPYDIEINGMITETEVSYDVFVTMDADMSSTNQKVDIFVVEDNIMSLWWVFGDIYHNARNVVRHWIVNEDLTITSSGESQNFSGSFMFDGEAWDPDNVKIIAMVQNDDNAEIFQVQEVNVNDMCDDNVWVPGNINGEVNTDQTITVDVFDVLSLAEIVASGDQGNCAYGISDITDDGNVNLLDVITLAMMIIEGSI